MKAKHEFNTDKEFYEYYKHYVAAQVASGLSTQAAWSPQIEKQAEAAGGDVSKAIAIYAVDIAENVISELANLNKTQ